jgi:hypothetical protein
VLTRLGKDNVDDRAEVLKAPQRYVVGEPGERAVQTSNWSGGSPSDRGAGEAALPLVPNTHNRLFALAAKRSSMSERVNERAIRRHRTVITTSQRSSGIEINIAAG